METWKMISMRGLLAYSLLLLLAFARCNAEKRTIRIVSILDQPYLSYGDDNDQDNYTGFCEDLAELICDELNMNHEIHLVKDGRYGTQNKSLPGHWNGIIGELLNNEADMAVAPLTITASRAEVVDFSTPFQEFQFSILLHKPDADQEDETDETLTVFSPFHLYLWLTILFSVLGMVFISLVIEWSFKSPETHEGFINFLRQDSIFRPESITGKVVRFVYFVFIIVIIGAYIASFSVQRFADSQPEVSEINGIKDLVKEDDIKFAIIGGGSTEAYLKGSNDEIYTKLYEIIDRENTTVQNYAEGLVKLRSDNNEERFAFVIESPKAKYFSTIEPCDLETARQEFGPTRGYAIATRKNSDLSPLANIAILHLKENGKLEDLNKKFWNNIECSDKEDGGDGGDSEDAVEEDDFDKLNLGEMAGDIAFCIMHGDIYHISEPSFSHRIAPASLKFPLNFIINCIPGDLLLHLPISIRLYLDWDLKYALFVHRNHCMLYEGIFYFLLAGLILILLVWILERRATMK